MSRQAARIDFREAFTRSLKRNVVWIEKPVPSTRFIAAYL